MKNTYRSQIENHFSNSSEREAATTKIPYLIVPNFPTLGLITSLRFLEWVAENPTGVISLPTGKTPEHFIKWTQYFLNNWESSKSIREENGLFLDVKPNLNGLHFVQIDEFYPIDPNQKNSFYSYVCEYYIKGFKLDPSKALLINSNEIELANGLHFTQVFPNLK
ncbi:MAG: glucosamine-6-phosphate isomerase, partial [Prolixibacteraceae bacterium]|nr:glucosamine-6-phosphate isomerase [Prolixibacteraceae bacterium]